MPFGLFRRSANRQVIDRLHGEIVAIVRQPELYVGYGVEDTFDGRFEILALVSTLFVRRLSLLPAPGPELAQQLTDAVFSGLDGSLREMGVGDLTVPKRMKKLAAAFLGRRQAYEEGLRSGDTQLLEAAIARNVHGGAFASDSPQVRRLVHYIRALVGALQDTSVESFRSVIPPLPSASDIDARTP
jgi:cytochrome b pre-mRNA-processing protein 3